MRSAEPATSGPAGQRFDAYGLYMLAAGQTICWTGLYYSFAALFLAWERQLGWTKTDLTLGLTVAVLIAAIVAPAAGRVTDRDGGRWMLTLGALGGAAALCCLASVTTQQGFLLAWAAIGVSQGLCLYEACFAYMTRVLGPATQPAILRLTLIAGFASPLSFVTGAYVSAAYSWQTAIHVYALAIVCIGAPLHYVGATRLERHARSSALPLPVESATESLASRRSETSARPPIYMAMRQPAFWLMALAFPLIAINHGMLLNHILPLLAERGVSTSTAVAAASVVGPMQVVGRLLIYRFEDRVTMLTVTFISVGGLILASALLLVAGAEPLLVFAFATTQGAAYGLVSVLRPVVIGDILGHKGFGSISGWLALPYLAAFAAAPYLGALLWTLGGYDLAIIVTLSCGVGGMAAFLILKRYCVPPR